MHGRLYLDTMHADHANLIMRYLLIWLCNLETGHTSVIVGISRSFSWYAMNKLMHVMQSWFLGYMNDHSNHLPWLNHGCKIECLHPLTCLACYLIMQSQMPFRSQGLQQFLQSLQSPFLSVLVVPPSPLFFFSHSSSLFSCPLSFFFTPLFLYLRLT